MVSNTRLYGAAIAIASGLYSVWNASTMSRLVVSSGVMLFIGIIVIAHGVTLLTAYADRLGNASGPLMIAYAVVMLVMQVLVGAGVLASGRGMEMSDGMGMGGSVMTAGMSWDAGMVTLAGLMLVSGLIMTRDGRMEHSTRM